MQTTTGFTSAHIAAWPGMLPPLLVLITFVGGCAGSTAGGMTMIRWQLVFKQAQRELTRLVHPRATLPVKFADKVVPGRVLAAVTGYFAIYLLLFGLMMLLVMAAGLDQVTAWSAVADQHQQRRARPRRGGVRVQAHARIRQVGLHLRDAGRPARSVHAGAAVSRRRSGATDGAKPATG